ncbi:MAG: hypothetical protein IJF99_06800 [Methanobrevibacter sp.]|nr:hypothetical protein [Methanobrevibacter sp.]
MPNQHFCSQCGREVYHDPNEETVKVPSKFESQVNEIEQEYNSKQAKATELVGKLFDPTHMSYSKFTNAIKKSNQLFANQLKITQRMMELESNEVVEAEIEKKIVTLNTFVDKMEDLINELVIQLSSNKDDNDDINDLFKDMDDLIGSVKDY